MSSIANRSIGASTLAVPAWQLAVLSATLIGAAARHRDLERPRRHESGRGARRA